MKPEVLIEERERADRAVCESEQRYKRLLASVTDYVYTVTVEGGRPVTTSHGPGCEAVTGYTPGEFDAAPSLWYQMIHEEDRPAVLAQAERILNGEAPVPLEHRIVHRDGSIRWIRNAPVPHKGDLGRLVGYDGLVSDITEHEQAEVALRESQERLALVIRGSSDGLWDWDLTTDEVYFSPRWKSMLGYEDHEIPNHFSSWERLLHPGDRERALAQVQAYLADRTATYELEQRLRHKDGSYRWILARGVALRDAAGKPVRMVGSHLDLTERKQAEEQLLVAQIRGAKFESVGTLAAGVAHGVKNPLQIIVMGLDYLDRNLPGHDENVAQVLSEVRNAAGRANALIRELLNFSAPEKFETKAEDWNALVERSLRLLNFEFVASKTTVVRHLAADLPPVRANCRRMEQVLLDLFLNSLGAMNQGGVLTVGTRSAHAGEDLGVSHLVFPRFLRGDRLVITEVLDTGPGILEAHLPRIFDPFFTTKPVGEGTGLGLAVVKKIVEQHDGVIDLRNAPKGGALVTLVLRAEQEKAS